MRADVDAHDHEGAPEFSVCTTVAPEPSLNHGRMLINGVLK